MSIYQTDSLFGGESRTTIAWGDYATSLSFDETFIIRSIIKLHNNDQPFDVDPCYSVGRFWQGLPQELHPRNRFDINPQVADCHQASADNLPLDDFSVGSVMYDPPFVTGTQVSGIPGKIKSRFSFFRTPAELWAFYAASIKEFARILRHDGLLVVKCQDMVSSSTQFMSHVEITRMAEEIGFYCKDMHILGSNNVMWSPNMVRQQHARKNHSYFLVFRKNPKMLAKVQKERDRCLSLSD